MNETSTASAPSNKPLGCIAKVTISVVVLLGFGLVGLLVERVGQRFASANYIRSARTDGRTLRFDATFDEVENTKSDTEWEIPGHFKMPSRALMVDAEPVVRALFTLAREHPDTNTVIIGVACRHKGGQSADRYGNQTIEKDTVAREDPIIVGSGTLDEIRRYRDIDHYLAETSVGGSPYAPPVKEMVEELGRRLGYQGKSDLSPETAPESAASNDDADVKKKRERVAAEQAEKISEALEAADKLVANSLETVKSAENEGKLRATCEDAQAKLATGCKIVTDYCTANSEEVAKLQALNSSLIAAQARRLRQLFAARIETALVQLESATSEVEHGVDSAQTVVEVQELRTSGCRRAESLVESLFPAPPDMYATGTQMRSEEGRQVGRGWVDGVMLTDFPKLKTVCDGIERLFGVSTDVRNPDLYTAKSLRLQMNSLLPEAEALLDQFVKRVFEPVSDPSKGFVELQNFGFFIPTAYGNPASNFERFLDEYPFRDESARRLQRVVECLGGTRWTAKVLKFRQNELRIEMEKRHPMYNPTHQIPNPLLEAPYRDVSSAAPAVERTTVMPEVRRAVPTERSKADPKIKTAQAPDPDVVPPNAPASTSKIVMNSATAAKIVSEQLRLQDTRTADELMRLYTDSVEYFGKDLDREAVRSDKLDYQAKWPVRHQKLASGVSIEEIIPGNKWLLHYVMSFAVENDAQKITGTSKDTIGVVAADGLHIYLEDGKVLTRVKEAKSKHK